MIVRLRGKALISTEDRISINMDTSGAPPSYEEAIREIDREIPAKPEAPGPEEQNPGGQKERPEPEENPSPPAEVDIAFLMDCTGSMGPFIQATKQNIEGIAYRLKQTEGCDVRFALVQFRDHSPQERTYVAATQDFTDDPIQMRRWLDKARAAGGGDQPEAVADALYHAGHLDWRGTATKICVLITDAPPHGLDRDLYDHFRFGCPRGHDPVALANQLAERDITLYCIGCEPCVSKWKHFYIALSCMTGGRYLSLTRVNLIPDIIVGGTREEISLRQLEERANQHLFDINAEEETELSEDELANRLLERLKVDKVQTTAMLARDDQDQLLDAVPEDAKALLQYTSLRQVRAVFVARRYKDEGRYRKRSPSWSGSDSSFSSTDSDDDWGRPGKRRRISRWRSRSRSRSRGRRVRRRARDSISRSRSRSRSRGRVGRLWRARDSISRSRSRSRSHDARSRSRSRSRSKSPSERWRTRDRDRSHRIAERSRSRSPVAYDVERGDVHMSQAKRLITWSRKRKAATATL